MKSYDDWKNVKVQCHGWGSTTFPVMALDELPGVGVLVSKAIYSPANYYNRDDRIDFQGSNDYITRFVKMYNQIEPFIDICCYNRTAESENAIMAIGESGQIMLWLW